MSDKYRVVGTTVDAETINRLISAGLMHDTWADFKGPADVTLEGGALMPEWAVPLFRDLGVLDVRVERKPAETWLVVP